MQCRIVILCNAIIVQMPIPVALRSKAWVRGRSLAGNVGSNPAQGGLGCLSVLNVMGCAGRSLDRWPVPVPEESYRVCVNVLVSAIKCNNKPLHERLFQHSVILTEKNQLLVMNV